MRKSSLRGLLTDVREATLRRFLPSQEVSREILGARLTLPRSHMLPTYSRHFPLYGRNLVELAAALNEEGGGTEFIFVDVGANIGDSACQVLRVTGGKALCVEGDPHWISYLQRNAADLESVVIASALLIPSQTIGPLGVAPTRSAGTTSFHALPRDEAGSVASYSTLTPTELLNLFPEFAHANLIKTDIDGWDIPLIPAIVSAWAQSRPVIFFEYDPAMTERAGNDPHGLWRALASSGYETAAIWDNYGEPLGMASVSELCVWENRGGSIDRSKCFYWDVAVAHSSDEAAVGVLHGLMEQQIDLR